MTVYSINKKNKQHRETIINLLYEFNFNYPTGIASFDPYNYLSDKERKLKLYEELKLKFEVNEESLDDTVINFMDYKKKKETYATELSKGEK